MGTRARGQMIGELPRLGQALDQEGNLKATVDFEIYSWPRAMVRLRRRRRDPECAGVPSAAAGQVRRLALLGLTRWRRSSRRRTRCWQPPARVQVTALEFEYRLSRPDRPPGACADPARQLRRGRARSLRSPDRRNEDASREEDPPGERATLWSTPASEAVSAVVRGVGPARAVCGPPSPRRLR